VGALRSDHCGNSVAVLGELPGWSPSMSVTHLRKEVPMTHQPLRYALAAGAAGLLALGGAGLANAATDDGSDTTVITDDSTATTTADDGTATDDSTVRPGGKAGCEDAAGGTGSSGSSTTDEGTPAPATATPSTEAPVDTTEL
jgi:hypothetical protein